MRELEFHDRQVWDPRIRVYRRIPAGAFNAERLRRLREQNGRLQQKHMARLIRAALVS